MHGEVCELWHCASYLSLRAGVSIIDTLELEHEDIDAKKMDMEMEGSIFFF